MRRTRIWTICIAFFVGLLIQGAGLLFGVIADNPNKYVQMNVYFDQGLEEIASSYDGAWMSEAEKHTNWFEHSIASIVSSKDKANIIITADPNFEYDTEKYNEAIIGYSPIVAIPPYDINQNNQDSGFTIMTSPNYYWYTYDMKKLVQAVMDSPDGKITLGDETGIKFDNLSTKIKPAIAIPDKQYACRRDVEYALAYILNDCKPITEKTDVQKLATDLNTLISKCTTIGNLGDIGKYKYTIQIIPEYLIVKGYSSKPVYWNNQLAVQLRMIYPKDAVAFFGTDNLEKIKEANKRIGGNGVAIEADVDQLYKLYVDKIASSISSADRLRRKYIRNNVQWSSNMNSRIALNVNVQYLDDYSKAILDSILDGEDFSTYKYDPNLIAGNVTRDNWIGTDKVAQEQDN